MEIKLIISRLSANSDVFKSLLSGLPKELYNFKPAPEKWTLLEIINHLYDEEQLDFRARVKKILFYPEEDFEPIDPQGWVTSRKYSERGMEESLNNFLNERKNSVEWLMNLSSPNWNSSKTHPAAGTYTAEQMLSNWLAHDLMHIRQIITRQYEYLLAGHEGYLSYAGDW